MLGIKVVAGIWSSSQTLSNYVYLKLCLWTTRGQTPSGPTSATSWSKRVLLCDWKLNTAFIFHNFVSNMSPSVAAWWDTSPRYSWSDVLSSRVLSFICKPMFLWKYTVYFFTCAQTWSSLLKFNDSCRKSRRAFRAVLVLTVDQPASD